MSQAVALLVLRAYSGIHAGTGQEMGVVDMPIQREGITNHPIIRGSSLKGALRQKATESLSQAVTKDGKPVKSPFVDWLFGPDSLDKGDQYAGALTVGDARLLLFPVRSLKGTFAWTACPLTIQRLQRELVDIGIPANTITLDQKNWPSIKEKDVWIDGTNSQLAFKANNQRQVVLEDLGLNVIINPLWNALTKNLAKLGVEQEELNKRLALVNDDIFQALVSFYTEIVTRTHLDDETKAVKKGQLWTEELLPAESLLISVLVCQEQRIDPSPNEGDNMPPIRHSGYKLLDYLKTSIGQRLQIGGNETVGYGVCHANWLGPFELNPVNPR